MFLLCEEIGDVLVQDDSPKFPKRKVLERESLGGIEDIDVVLLSNTRVNNLREDIPGGVVPVLDALVQASSLEVRVHACLLCRVMGVEVLNTPGCLQVDLDVFK